MVRVAAGVAGALAGAVTVKEDTTSFCPAAGVQGTVSSPSPLTAPFESNGVRWMVRSPTRIRPWPGLPKVTSGASPVAVPVKELKAETVISAMSRCTVSVKSPCGASTSACPSTVPVR